MTNDGQSARDFIASVGGTALYKPMSVGILGDEGRVKVINANLVTADLVDDASIVKTAHTFQQFIDKQYDVRVTVIGERSFAVAIHAGSEPARIDWRADYDALSYVEIDLPRPVSLGIERYLTATGLAFAAFDFSVARDSKWWFLEANPNGLWAWIEERANVPIAPAIADFIVEGGRSV